MSAETYFSGWEAKYQTCTRCGWRGLGSEASTELFTELLQVDCPACDGRLFLVVFPTADEVKRAADEGVPQAVSMQRAADRREVYFQRREGTLLRGSDSLPDLDGEVLDFHLTLIDDDTGDLWLVLAMGTGEADEDRIEGIEDPRVLHAELAAFEDTEPARRISQLLEERYGTRYRHLYAGRALVYLGGDDLSAWSRICSDLGRHDPS